MLSYHTFFAEYTGATPEEVIQAVYADAKAGTGMSYEDWWQYQRDLWQMKYVIDVPAIYNPEAAQRLLDILTDVGALERKEG